jgi:MerR family transcriptional regulator, thiopeptide resistance regulator
MLYTVWQKGGNTLDSHFKQPCRFYYISEFAQKASVSIRTLRYYDNAGLLSPSRYTEAGYRLYSDDDLLTLQQILALKFLGFSLEEIKAFLRSGPQRLQEVIAVQRAMMQERRVQLDNIIQALDETEKLLQERQCDWESIVRVIRVIQMEQNKEWINKYFTPEQQQAMKQLSEQSYSPAAKEKMAQRSEWTEEDQRRADQQWGAVQVAVKRLTAEGADPASAEAQAVIEQEQGLVAGFTQGDPEIRDGLKQWWKNFGALSDEQKPFAAFYTQEEQAFLDKARQVYRQQHGSA